MQHDHPLTLQHVLERMRRMHGDSEVVTLAATGATRATVRRGGRARRPARRRARRRSASSRATASRPSPGTRQRAPRGSTSPSRASARCSTRSTSACSPTSSTYIVNHAEDRVVFVDAVARRRCSAARADASRRVEHYVVMGDGDAGSLPSATRLRGAARRRAADGFDYPELDERQAAGAVLHERHHRQPEGRPLLPPLDVLHSLGACLADAHRRPRARPRAAGRADVPRQRLGHALRRADGGRRPRHARARPQRRARSRALIESEQRDASPAPCRRSGWTCCATPTSTRRPVQPARPSSAAGRPCRASLMQRFEDRHGVRILQAWGMTETSPLGVRRRARRRARRATSEWRCRAHGRPARCRSSRPASSATTASEAALGRRSRPASSRCAARGSPRAYYDDDSSDEKFDDGWLRTGDIAAIDPRGYIRIVRPRQGRHQVGRRVDLVGRARERDHGPPRGEGGGGDRDARRALGRAPAGLRGHRGGPPAHARRAARPPRRPGGEVVAAGRARVRRRGARRRASASSTRRCCGPGWRRAGSNRPSRPRPEARLIGHAAQCAGWRLAVSAIH